MSFENKNEAEEINLSASFKMDILHSLLYPACIITSKGLLDSANNPFLRLFDIEEDGGKQKFDWSKSFVCLYKKNLAQAFVKSLNGAFTKCVAEVSVSKDRIDRFEVMMQPFVREGSVNSVFVLLRDYKEDSGSINFNSDLFCDGNGFSDHYEYIPLPLIRFNLNFEVMKCSRSFEGVIGYSFDDLGKESWPKFSSIFKYDSERIKDIIFEIVNGNIPFKRIGEIKITCKNDDEKVVNIVIYPIIKNDVIQAIDLLMEDVTKLVDLKYKLSMSKRLNLVRDIRKGFFHSINNKVNEILNQIQFLHRISEQDSVSQGLLQIENYMYEMAEQIRRVYNFIDERAESSVEREESFENIVNDAIAFVRIHFKVDGRRRSKNISIDKKCDYDLNIRTNTQFLRELFIWAMLRVSAYLDKKGQINVKFSKTSFYYLNFSVEKVRGRENGNIIPFTLDGYSSSEMRSEAEKLNLKIIEEESDENYSIRIILPFKMVIEKKKITNENNAYSIVDKDIMIVEDDQAIRLILENLFKKMGNRVFVANNGIEALEEFRKKNYDILLADYDIEGLTGIELSARVKELNEDTITVLLSSLSIENISGYNKFIDFFIGKSFNIDDLIKGILSIYSSNKK